MPFSTALSIAFAHNPETFLTAVVDGWPGWPAATAFGNGIDGDLWEAQQKRVYFFKSSEYVAFDLTANKVANGRSTDRSWLAGRANRARILVPMKNFSR